METQLEIHPHSGGRSRIHIKLQLSPQELEDLQQSQASRHTDSESPFPIQTFSSPNPQIRSVQGLPIVNGEPQKCFFLTSARRVLLNRPIPGKTHLRMPIPSEIDLGYINPHETERLTNWWKKTRGEIAQQLQKSLYHTNTPTFTSETPQTILEQNNLNPIDPQENKGTRKRGLDVY